MISGIFAPVCYVLAARGLLQGLLIILTMAVPSVTETGVYQVFNFISWTPFTFLPVLLAISASKHFHCNPYIAAACCLALVNPVWTEMAGKIAEGENIRFLFVNLTEITYSSSVLPPLILVALLSKLEKKGYITRTPSPNDKRVIIVHLTEKGASAEESENSQVGPDDIFGCLSEEEQSIFREYLDRMIDDLEARCGEGSERRRRCRRSQEVSSEYREDAEGADIDRRQRHDRFFRG